MDYEYYDYLIEYRSAIVDELGDIVCWCDDLKNNEVDSFLIAHPECRKQCIRVN